MSPTVEVGSYSTRSGKEQILLFSSNLDIQVIILEPILEERNFLRRTTVGLARALATRGIGSMIPDLPGCGESALDLREVTIGDWRDAVAALSEAVMCRSGRQPHIAALRGGSLLDDAAKGASWWRFAPVDGADLLRPLRQAQRFNGRQHDESLAGYVMQPEMIAELERASPRPPSGLYRHCVIQPAGTPLWRRAEPSEDLALAETLAGDLTDWVESCAAA